MAYWGVILVWLSIRYRGFMGQVCIYPVQRQMQISWLKEVFPMQWKIAVSSIAAYFTSYLFVPLLFVWRGAVEAGKMGMSLKLSSLVFTVSIAWISSRAPLYGAFIQKKQYKELDKLAFRCSKQAVLVSLVITVAVVLVLTILAGYFPKYRDRALSWWVVGILCLANVICVVNSAIGGYLRANKEEPLMVITLIVAAFSAVMSFVATKYYDANYLSVGYFLIMLCIGLPGFFWILRTKLKERHGQ
jgi:Na+-driven multidrug efflux pump